VLQKFQAKQLKNRGLNKSFYVDWSIMKFSTTTEIVCRQKAWHTVHIYVCTGHMVSIRKLNRQGSGLIAGFSFVMAEPPAALKRLFPLLALYFCTSPNLSRHFHPQGDSRDRTPKTFKKRQRLSERLTQEQHQEFESTLFVASLLFL
jgi:hypothetical protein